MEIDGVKCISNAEEQYCLVVFFFFGHPALSSESMES